MTRQQEDQAVYSIGAVARMLDIPTSTLRAWEERSVEPRPLILIAERDSYVAGLAEHFLRTEGYQVAIASDARQARLHFDERSPDAVIIDLLLSGGAGFRLCAEFAAKGTAQVLAISAIDTADEAMRSRPPAFLPTPLDPLF